MNLQRCYFRIRLLRSSAVLFVSIILLSGVSISLVSSFLDPSFGTNGVTITSLEGNSYGSSVAIQTDGKIVVAGSTVDASKEHFALVRYTVSGTLDAAFGTEGVVTTDVSANAYDQARVVTIQPDGKLVVAGDFSEWPQAYLALARYTKTGTLDPEFGVGGVVTTPMGEVVGASGMAIQPDGRIVVAGTRSWARYFFSPFVKRYTITGSLDTGFDASKMADQSLMCNASSVVIQPDHKIVVAGGTDCLLDGEIYLVRMNQNGSLDTTFGISGTVRTSVPGSSCAGASAIALQTDGKIVVAGSSALNDKYNFLAARYSITGTLDSAFGSGGIVTTSLGLGDDRGYSIAVQPDGRIVVGGSSNDGTRNNFGLVRYLSSGAPDTQWGIGGVITSSVGASSSTGESVALQSDGKIVLAGWSSDDGFKTNFAVARYLRYLAGMSFLYLPIVRRG